MQSHQMTETSPLQQISPSQPPLTIPSDIPCDLTSSNNNQSTSQANPDQEGDFCAFDGDSDAPRFTHRSTHIWRHQI